MGQLLIKWNDLAQHHVDDITQRTHRLCIVARINAYDTHEPQPSILEPAGKYLSGRQAQTTSHKAVFAIFVKDAFIAIALAL